MHHIGYRQWATPADFATGELAGTQVRDGRLVLTEPEYLVAYDDPHSPGSITSFEVATWTSSPVSTGFEFSELIASWNTSTPAGTWIEIDAQVVGADGTWSKSYCLGRWAMDPSTIKRTSVAGQGDEIADVAIDVLQARDTSRLVGYQLTVSLYRLAGSDLTPEVRFVSAMASARPPGLPPLPQRAPGSGSGVVLRVPPFSQELHKGQYPEFSGGGEAWCSPASTAMVLAYYGAGPAAADYSWVDPTHANPWVVHAAAHTHDWVYGSGNWPFNTAYASELGMRAFVTRLRSLAEARQFISAGFPLIASVSFAEDELAGAGYATAGHLLVIVGFTETGDVIVDDPASHLIPSDTEVRTVYDQQQFSAAWLSGSGGLVYVIHPEGAVLPPPPAEANW